MCWSELNSAQPDECFECGIFHFIGYTKLVISLLKDSTWNLIGYVWKCDKRPWRDLQSCYMVHPLIYMFIGGSSELPMWLTGCFLVTFFGRWWGAVHIHGNTQILRVTYGNRLPCITVWRGHYRVESHYRVEGTLPCGTSHQSEILHSLIFHIIIFARHAERNPSKEQQISSWR